MLAIKVGRFSPRGQVLLEVRRRSANTADTLGIDVDGVVLNGGAKEVCPPLSPGVTWIELVGEVVGSTQVGKGRQLGCQVVCVLVENHAVVEFVGILVAFSLNKCLIPLCLKIGITVVVLIPVDPDFRKAGGTARQCSHKPVGPGDGRQDVERSSEPGIVEGGDVLGVRAAGLQKQFLGPNAVRRIGGDANDSCRAGPRDHADENAHGSRDPNLDGKPAGIVGHCRIERRMRGVACYRYNLNHDVRRWAQCLLVEAQPVWRSGNLFILGDSGDGSDFQRDRLRVPWACRAENEERQADRECHACGFSGIKTKLAPTKSTKRSDAEEIGEPFYFSQFNPHISGLVLMQSSAAAD